MDSLPNFFPVKRAVKIKELMEEIIILDEEKQREEFLIASKLILLIHMLLDEAHYGVNDNIAKYYSLAHDAKKIIEERFSEKISNAYIANELNLSTSHFRLLFSKTYGITPHQYLTTVRINNAKQMLWSKKPIDEIAERCGFNCQQYFTEIFKKEVGVTPGEYRKIHSNQFYKRKNDSLK